MTKRDEQEIRRDDEGTWYPDGPIWYTYVPNKKIQRINPRDRLLWFKSKLQGHRDSFRLLWDAVPDDFTPDKKRQLDDIDQAIRWIDKLLEWVGEEFDEFTYNIMNCSICLGMALSKAQFRPHEDDMEEGVRSKKQWVEMRIKKNGSPEFNEKLNADIVREVDELVERGLTRNSAYAKLAKDEKIKNHKGEKLSFDGIKKRDEKTIKINK